MSKWQEIFLMFATTMNCNIYKKGNGSGDTVERNFPCGIGAKGKVCKKRGKVAFSDIQVRKNLKISNKVRMVICK